MINRELSLAYLTTSPLDPVAAIEIAARLEVSGLGLRIRPATPNGEASPLESNPAMLAATRVALAATGVKIFDVEIIRIDAGFDIARFQSFLDVCAQLSARAILVAGDDPDEARLSDNFAIFAEHARTRNLTADLEFMPWIPVRDARTALRIVERAGPNARVLVDTLHVPRSGTTLADIAAIPPGRLNYVQLCDAPAEIPADEAGMIDTARRARLLPGDGGIDLAGIFRTLPPDLPVSIEIPNVEGKESLGVEEWSRRAVAASRAFLASLT